MAEEVAPGLTADWLNGWLAAIGVTVLLPDARLSWTQDAIPVASFLVPDGPSAADRVGAVLDDPAWIDRLVIRGLPRKVTRDDYRKAAVRARRSEGTGVGRDLSLSASVTDLVRDSRLSDGGQLPHSPFDPSAPGTTGAVFDRVASCVTKLREVSSNLTDASSATFAGRGIRIQANGLGFDPRRLVAGVQPKGQVFVDPVVELLCFFGLVHFPIRGNGTRVQPRGWAGPASRRGSFAWPIWEPRLDAWGIDALLDRFYNGEPRSRLRRLGIRGAFQSVSYRQLDRSDPTRAYGSEALPWP